MARAFVSDPLLVWMFPNSDLRSDMTAAWLGLLVEAYLRDGRVDSLREGDRTTAMAAWRIPDDATIGMPESPSTGGLLAGMVGQERAEEISGALASLLALRPAQPFAYLQLLAVHPEAQGRGFGRRVLAPGLAAADEVGLGTHLETTNRRNVPFYESLGFEVTGSIRLPSGGPEAWAMWRLPATV